jgi:myo-inositol 2-dehydrogenase / D-chiro-inositol 1-dehydrogenase
MLKVGIIGLGQMGRLHLYNCNYIKGVKVIAAADKSERLLKKAQALGVKQLFTDYDQMLETVKDLDTVIISLPNSLHSNSAVHSLESGVNVFIEKPLARNVQECEQIINATKKSGRKLMVGHCMRWLDAIQRIKGEIDKGHIGKLEVITAEEILNGPFSDGTIPTPVPEWWFNVESTGGGVLLDIGYHMIDLYRFFAGDADVVHASLDHNFNLPMEDGAIVVLKSRKTGIKGIINVGWYQKSVFPNFNFRFIVHGTAGFASSDQFVPKNPYTHAIKEGSKNLFRRAIGRDIRPLSYTYHYEQYVNELRSFFDCLSNDTEPPVTGVDGLKTVEIVMQAYQASINSQNNRLRQ